MARVIKEIIIILIICLISMLTFAIILYEYIPNRKVVPQVETYAASSEVETLLADDIDSKENEVVLTYKVSSRDLDSYEIKNEYVPGKANPFASIVEEPTENTTSNKTTNSTTNETQSNETKSNETVEKPENEETHTNSFIDDGGIK